MHFAKTKNHRICVTGE